ncbi:MAG: hypothetical protein SVX43_20850, partial [Cyanobacteriota bacterium]|nr:hypothetical protein [Cyanobacteriota bacterium]
MFGTFQQSQIRIEVDAPANIIGESLLRPRQLRQWMLVQRLETGLPESLHSGLTFTHWFGPVPVQHYVQLATSNVLRLLLSKGVDGYHEWYWGEGWVQSRLEGVSLLPLSLGHSASLLRLRDFV